VNILGGINGSGKSTILKASYELVAQGRIDDLKCVRLMDSVKITFTNDWCIIWEKEDLDNIQDKWYEKVMMYTLDDMDNKKNYSCIIQVKDKNGICQDNDIIAKSVTIEFVNSFEQRVSDAIRLSKRPEWASENDSMLLDENIREELNYRNEIYSGAYESLMELLQKDGKVDLENHIDIKEYFQLMDVCGRFFDGYSLSLGSKLEFRNGNNRIPFNNLSMGQKQLLLILLMVTNTQKQPSVFIMDEPDLGMHVDWKKKLIKEIHQLNPNMQLIVSTHAPSMVTGWNDCVKEVGQITLKGED
jgi:ABC-type molybdenum transport system ATPase subunit/photorepair protein PhrA